MDFELNLNLDMSYYFRLFHNPSVLPLDGKMQNFTIVEKGKSKRPWYRLTPDGLCRQALCLLGIKPIEVVISAG